MVTIIERPSPNHDARPEGQVVDLIVLHYTGMRSAEEALERLRGPAAKVSAHYFLDEDGSVSRLVPEHRRAWHAGVASWRGSSDINARSLGIELVNPGHEFGYRPFPEAQMAALIELCHVLRARHGIERQGLVGHSDVAPLRKLDPGEFFDWRRLAGEGLSVWPEQRAAAVETTPLRNLRRLQDFGYGYLAEDPGAVVRAFQRRFRPSVISGEIDAETAALLGGLVA